MIYTCSNFLMFWFTLTFWHLAVLRDLEFPLLSDSVVGLLQSYYFLILNSPRITLKKNREIDKSRNIYFIFLPACFLQVVSLSITLRTWPIGQHLLTSMVVWSEASSNAKPWRTKTNAIQGDILIPRGLEVHYHKNVIKTCHHFLSNNSLPCVVHVW